MHAFLMHDPHLPLSHKQSGRGLVSTFHACGAGSVSIRPVQRSRLQVRADKGEEGGPAGRSKQAQAPEAG